MGAALVQVVRQLPAEPGVYRFRDGEGQVLYVGRAAHLRSRVGSYWSDPGDRRHLKAMVAAVADVEALVCGSRHEAAWLERNMLEAAALPPWNRTAGGQETPLVILLDRRPSRPRVLTAHLPFEAGGACVFGPFLGGLQVRHALAGLHRLYPLAYTGDRVSSSERAMAAERGVGVDDRDALGDVLTAILRRDPGAVAQAVAQLEALRERAMAVEAFELAARIDDELSGLSWISSVQRVSTLGGEDIDISAWSGGVLVRLGLRSGRLQEWTSLRCDRLDATPYLMRSPAQWTDFAQRNADLAAGLVSAAVPPPPIRSE